MSKIASCTTQVFSKNLVRHRTKLGISKFELSRRCGISRAYVTKIEQGLSSPSLEMVDKIVKGLQLKSSKVLLV